MVLSSQISFERYVGGSGEKSGKPVSASEVPFRSGRVVLSDSRLFLSSPPSDQQYLLSQSSNNARQYDGAMKKQQYIAHRLGRLNPHVVDRIYQMCVNDDDDDDDDALQILPGPSTAVDNRAARLLNIDQVPAQRQAGTQYNASKRKRAVSADVSDEEDDDDHWENQGNTQITVHIAHQDEVVHFLRVRFTQIQQLATKVIAKAWIKAICPKKQANFPYVDSNPRPEQSQKRRRPRHDGDPRIPKFWPTELCRHKEPDHTRKAERTHLLVHLLRLHWTEREWIESNGPSSEVPQKIKDNNWVGFLKDAFPISKLDEMQGGSPEKAQMRKKYLGQIYRVAEDEQMILRKIGPSDQARTYTTGSGWVAADAPVAGSASQSDRPDSEEASSPSTKHYASAMARSDSQTDNCMVSPESEGQDGDHRSTFASSDMELVTDAKFPPQDDFVPMGAAMVSNPSQDMDMKFDPSEESVANPLVSVPLSRGESLDYYGPTWSGNTAIVHGAPDMYAQQHQYTTPHWYQGATLPACQPATVPDTQAWSDYRHGYGALQTAPIPNKAANHIAGSHGPHFGELQDQMAMSSPFMQPDATASVNNQHAIYQRPGVQYFSQHSHPEYMSTQHPGMYGTWP